MLPPREPVEPRLNVPGGRVPERRLDDPVEAGLDLFPPVDVRRHAGGDAAAEGLLPAVARRLPARVDCLHAAPQLPKGEGGLGRDGTDLGVHRVGPAEVVAVGDAQPLHAPAERLHVIDAGGGERVLVALVGARADVHHQRCVRDRPRHGTDVGEAPRRAEGIDGDEAEGRLQPEDAGARRGDPDGAAAVGADRQRSQPGRDRRARPTARAARRAVEVPRVARDAEQQVVGGADPAEGGRVGLAELDGPRRPEPLHHRRVLGGDIVGVEPRAERRPDPLRDHEVLGGERHPVERSEGDALLREGALGGAGILHRLIGRQRDERVERGVHALDPREDGAHHLHRRELLLPDGRRHLRGRHPAEIIRSHGTLLYDRWNTTILSSVISCTA